MKIKAVYMSKTNRHKISVCGETFFNGVPRIANLSHNGISIIKKAAEQGWFKILEEYKKGNVKATPVVDTEEVVEETVETPAEEVVEETVETPAEEVVEEEVVEETVETPAEEVVEETDISLNDMKKDELIALAKEQGIEVSATMKKDEIIAAITQG